MNNSDLIELEKKKSKLITGMRDYMNDEDEDFDPGYTEADIQKCDKILMEFLDNLQKLRRDATQPEILAFVKIVVLELNKLNESVGHGLIETGQREDLCDYILYAASHSGLKTAEDVTEEWREW